MACHLGAQSIEAPPERRKGRSAITQSVQSINFHSGRCAQECHCEYNTGYVLYCRTKPQNLDIGGRITNSTRRRSARTRPHSPTPPAATVSRARARCRAPMGRCHPLRVIATPALASRRGRARVWATSRAGRASLRMGSMRSTRSRRTPARARRAQRAATARRPRAARTRVSDSS